MSKPEPPSEELICQTSSPLTIAGLLGGVTVFKVPSFQRDYSWDENAVKLFINDLERCRRARITGTPLPHFFGAIVTCPELEPGTPRPHAMLIDGQQRIATLFMYLIRLKDQFAAAADRAETAEFECAFRARSREISTHFEYVDDLDFKTPIQRRKLNLNRADNQLFKSTLDRRVAEPTRTSHIRILAAARIIDEHFERLFMRRDSSVFDERVLNTLYTSFMRDFEIVHISARTRKQANTIYRVLNSRGVPVSDCELLRAATLERLEYPLNDEDFGGVIGTWDEFLGLEGAEPDDFLNHVYQSHNGSRRPTDRTAATFESSFFATLETTEPLTAAEADKVAGQVVRLRDDCLKISMMLAGDPCRPAAHAMTAVSKDRFHAMTCGLKQKYCIPLLLAAQRLDTPSFSGLVECLDRFSFRYGVIVRGPIGPFDRLVAPYIEQLRQEPPTFDLTALTSDLNTLCEKYAPDDVFSQKLSALRYASSGNATIRYMLAMMEVSVRSACSDG